MECFEIQTPKGACHERFQTDLRRWPFGYADQPSAIVGCDQTGKAVGLAGNRVFPIRTLLHCNRRSGYIRIVADRMEFPFAQASEQGKDLDHPRSPSSLPSSAVCRVSDLHQFFRRPVPEQLHLPDLGVALASVVILLTFVVPTFESMLSDLGTKMPAITTFVLGLARFFQHRWYIVIVAITAIVVSMRIFSHSRTGEYFYGKIALKLPLIGQLTVKTASARMARTLGTLIGAGLPLVDSLSIVSNTMTNIFFKENSIFYSPPARIKCE